jgi:hypothetical protein
VTNVGAEDVKVLKYSNILDYALPTQSFVVTKDGAQAAFTGIQVKLFSTIQKLLKYIITSVIY